MYFRTIENAVNIVHLNICINLVFYITLLFFGIHSSICLYENQTVDGIKHYRRPN